MISKLIKFAIGFAKKHSLVKFGIVGTLCALLQILILRLLTPYMPAFLASAIGFFTSAQLNFILTYTVTWRDSERKKGIQFASTWVRFFGVVLIGLVVNTAMFSLFHLVLVDWLAVCAAVVISTSCTFYLNRFHVLRPERHRDTNDPTVNRSVPARTE